MLFREKKRSFNYDLSCKENKIDEDKSNSVCAIRTESSKRAREQVLN